MNNGYKKDLFFSTVIQVGALTGVGFLVMICLVILANAVPALNTIGIQEFVGSSKWSPTSQTPSYGVWALLVGSLSVSAGAVLVSLPLGVFFSCFLNFYAPGSMAFFGRRMIEILSGIPSIVLGFWGLVVLAPLVNAIHPPGASLLTAILTLSIMITPTIVITLDAAMRNCRSDLLEACKSLAISRETYLWKIVFPQVRFALVTGTILAFTRAIGETMVVVMASGNVIQFPDSLFAPVRTITANLALEIGYADPLHRAALFLTSLFLLVLTGLLILADPVGRRRT